MKKINAIILCFLAAQSFSFAEIISGDSAKLLYELLSVTPENIENVSVKSFGHNWQCQEEMVMDETNPFLSFRYYCIVPDPRQDGRIYFDGPVAQGLYDRMPKKFAKQSLKNYVDSSVMIRTLPTFECRLIDYIDDKNAETKYECSLKP